MTNTAEAPNTSISESLTAVSAKLAKSDPCKARVPVQPIANTKSDKVSASRKPKPKRKTKSAAVEKLLKRKSGATIDQICRSTGWQAHTCRAFLAGLRKKGREVVRETVANGKGVYRITSASTDEEAC